jgi:hypothetical protein
MDQAPLVSSDIEIESKVVWALSNAKIPITAVNWSWIERGEKHQLIVVTPLVDTRGPRATYGRIFQALSAAGLYQPNLVRKLSVKSPADPFAQKLIEELRRTSEGAIHIVRSRTKNGVPQYNVVFAPYHGSGGPIPSKPLKGDAGLRAFLEERVGVHLSAINQALAELAQTDSATIFNVQLNRRQLKRLDLAA